MRSFSERGGVHPGLAVGALEPPPSARVFGLMRGGGGRAPVGRAGGEDSRWHGFGSHGLQNPCHLPPKPRLGPTHMSSRPVAPRRPARADAKRSIWPELSTCHPVPQHRADRRKRTAKPELPGWVRHTCHPVP